MPLYSHRQPCSVVLSYLSLTVDALTLQPVGRCGSPTWRSPRGVYDGSTCISSQVMICGSLRYVSDGSRCRCIIYVRVCICVCERVHWHTHAPHARTYTHARTHAHVSISNINQSPNEIGIFAPCGIQTTR